MATAAAQATEARKHQANDPKCSELGWVCVPMVVETYGAWGKEATAIISSVASRLATSTCRPKSTILHKIYGRLNLNLHLDADDGIIATASRIHRLLSWPKAAVIVTANFTAAASAFRAVGSGFVFRPLISPPLYLTPGLYFITPHALITAPQVRTLPSNAIPQPFSSSPDRPEPFSQQLTDLPLPPALSQQLPASSSPSLSPVSPAAPADSHDSQRCASPTAGPSFHACSQQIQASNRRHRQRCIVEDCPEYIAPTMWRSHMLLHAQGVYPGEVPRTWLVEQNSFICSHCRHIISNSRFSSHSRKCTGGGGETSGAGAGSYAIRVPPSSIEGVGADNSSVSSLPSFEDVFLLNQSTLRFIPSKSRPAFARALSSALRSIIRENSEEAWLKLFMLPKCVLPSSRRRGLHDRPLSIDTLCNMWIENDLTSLWNLAKSRVLRQNEGKSGSSSNQHSKKINQAVSLGRSGMMGKACRVLQSDGIAPNNETTWELLKAKHPSGPVPLVPATHSVPVTLDQDFNILSILHSFPKDAAAGPSGLRVQHLLAAASIPLPTLICPLLLQVVNILLTGKAPPSIARFVAGAGLIALNKIKEGCPRDYGVACRAGAEKVIHQVRECLEEHWMDEDFVCFKVDMKNAFNLVSRQTVLEECATFYPELLPWVSYCYGSHPLLCHPLGKITSECGVQQGDPLGPLLFSLVLHKLVSTIDADDECFSLLLQAWYLDDGVLAGSRPAVLRAVHLLEELGPVLGIHINLTKCELFGRMGNTAFPPSVRSSLLPNLDILGTPIGDYLHCTRFICEKISQAKGLLSALVDVAAADLHVATSLLRICGSFCKLVHLARTTPPSISADSLQSFDEEHALSRKLDSHLFHSIMMASSPANKARLLSSSAAHASSWLSVVPSVGLGLHLDSSEFHTAVIWWLGMNFTARSSCPFCPDTALDPLGHHAVSCRHGGDVVIRHNRLRNIIADFCRRAHLSVRIEVGRGLLGTHNYTRPADVLVDGWDRAKPAAFDVTVTSPLTPVTLNEASINEGAAALAAETRKHAANDARCQALGWSCIPLAVETFGNWGREAQGVFSRLATLLALHQGRSKSTVVRDIYGHLSISLVRSVARSIMGREIVH
ncbi:hypothetical protein EMCRGX_G011922 [Ephydatia muelleri]